MSGRRKTKKVPKQPARRSKRQSAKEMPESPPDNGPPTPPREISVHDHMPHLGPYGKEWYITRKGNDPIFSDLETELKSREVIGSLQPYEDTADIMYPTFMEPHGFERLNPADLSPEVREQLVSTYTNMLCYDYAAMDDKNKAPSRKCHYNMYIPSFVYSHPELECERCKSLGLPTIHFRAPRRKGGWLRSCLICAAGRKSPCSITKHQFPFKGDESQNPFTSIGPSSPSTSQQLTIDMRSQSLSPPPVQVSTTTPTAVPAPLNPSTPPADTPKTPPPDLHITPPTDGHAPPPVTPSHISTTSSPKRATTSSPKRAAEEMTSPTPASKDLDAPRTAKRHATEPLSEQRPSKTSRVDDTPVLEDLTGDIHDLVMPQQNSSPFGTLDNVMDLSDGGALDLSTADEQAASTENYDEAYLAAKEFLISWRDDDSASSVSAPEAPTLEAIEEVFRAPTLTTKPARMIERDDILRSSAHKFSVTAVFDTLRQTLEDHRQTALDMETMIGNVVEEYSSILQSAAKDSTTLLQSHKTFAQFVERSLHEKAALTESMVEQTHLAEKLTADMKQLKAEHTEMSASRETFKDLHRKAEAARRSAELETANTLAKFKAAHHKSSSVVNTMQALILSNDNLRAQLRECRGRPSTPEQPNVLRSAQDIIQAHNELESYVAMPSHGESQMSANVSPAKSDAVIDSNTALDAEGDQTFDLSFLSGTEV